jgi:hypothetical protein
MIHCFFFGHEMYHCYPPLGVGPTDGCYWETCIRIFVLWFILKGWVKYIQLSRLFMCDTTFFLSTSKGSLHLKWFQGAFFLIFLSVSLTLLYMCLSIYNQFYIYSMLIWTLGFITRWFSISCEINEVGFYVVYLKNIYQWMSLLLFTLWTITRWPGEKIEKRQNFVTG